MTKLLIMKKIYLLNAISFFAGTMLFSQCANQSNIYTFTYNGKQYEVVKEQKTWANAAACAVARGGYLAQIGSAGENTAVYNAIVAAGVSSTYTVVNDGGGIAYVWIGATDQATEGTWLWDGNNDGAGTNFWNGQGNAGAGGGSAANGCYFNWGDTHLGQPDEPDNYQNIQDGGAMGLASWPYGIAGEWNDISMSNSLYYVIEYDSTTGINNPKKHSHTSVFPNPANDKLKIVNDDPWNSIASLNISNQLGEIVFAQQNFSSTDLSIDTTGMENGIYFLCIAYRDGERENEIFAVSR